MTRHIQGIQIQQRQMLILHGLLRLQPSIYSSPAEVDGKLYVGSWDGKIYAFDQSSPPTSPSPTPSSEPTPVPTVSPTPTPVPTPTPTPTPTAIPKNVITNMPTPTPSAVAPHTLSPSPTNKPKVPPEDQPLIVCAIVIVVALLGLIGIAIFKRKKGKPIQSELYRSKA
jgi:hypothetical protein